MSYWLGIDFGTTFTAAAVNRDGEQTVELVPLGENGTSAASVVFWRRTARSSSATRPSAAP
jgi:molecular chaperone DnaK (HSP70)